jgi:ribosomal protein S18 acetylase RimI-like enzyme
MRIRTFRYEDIHALLPLQQLAAQADGIEPLHDIASWPSDLELDATENAFVITDDDDDLNTWGQAGTLEGIEGEIIGYTLVQLRQGETGYHLLCEGAVHPAQRQRRAGRALLICALNRARALAEEFEFEAEQAGVPVYFEALLPTHNPASARLAAKCEMTFVREMEPDGLSLYRSDL